MKLKSFGIWSALALLALTTACTKASPTRPSDGTASGAAFASKVYTKDGVAAGNGTTALKIDKLAANKSYFWRARAQSGSLLGPYTEGRGFGIGPEVILAQPVYGDPQ